MQGKGIAGAWGPWMAKIAYVLLCHKDAEQVARQVRHLTAAGDCVVIHFDGRTPKAEYDRLRSALGDVPGVAFTARRVKCAWGSWSLVEATLEALRAGLQSFPDASHFYMISGDCAPIKTAEFIHARLDSAPRDMIESVDFFTSGWIRTGLSEERLVYRHLFNERSHKRLFYASLGLQQKLGLRRSLPPDLTMMIGSQWWCLRRATVEKVMAFCATRRDVMRFFRTTWIPDETFFQTLVRHLVPDDEIISRPPTFLIFTDYGMPVVFHADHHDMLLVQDYLFARKISPQAKGLRDRLGAMYGARGRAFAISDNGRALFDFLTGRGRIGRRFAPRFWEAGAQVGRRRELLLLVCHDWQFGQRLSRSICRQTGLAHLGYVFDDASAPLPPLGGIETGLAKRSRHRRALLTLIYEYHAADRLLICVDPASFDTIRDLAEGGDMARILAVEPVPDATSLARISDARGLVGPNTPAGVAATLTTPLARALRDEIERLREAGFRRLSFLQPAPAPDDPAVQTANAAALAAFLRLPAETCADILRDCAPSTKETADAPRL